MHDIDSPHETDTAPSAPVTTARPNRVSSAERAEVVGRRVLPGDVRASVGLPAAETAVFVAVVPLLGLPVLLATMAATWAVAGALVLTAAVAWLCLARRVVVGDDWVADRRVWRYRVLPVAQLRVVELAENAHGGLLLLRPQRGRPFRLRRPELTRGDLRDAVSSVLADGTARLGDGVPALLGLHVAEPALHPGPVSRPELVRVAPTTP